MLLEPTPGISTHFNSQWEQANRQQETLRATVAMRLTRGTAENEGDSSSGGEDGSVMGGR